MKSIKGNSKYSSVGQVYFQENKKLEEHQANIKKMVRSSSSASRSKASLLVRPSHKHTIDDLIREFKIRELGKKQKGVSKIAQKLPQNPEVKMRQKNPTSQAQSLPHCKSERSTLRPRPIESLDRTERTQQLQSLRKKTLLQWKSIRGTKKRQQRQQKNELVQEIKQRRRQSEAQALLKRQAARESTQLQHQLSREWVCMMRKLRRSMDVKVKKSIQRDQLQSLRNMKFKEENQKQIHQSRKALEISI